MFNSVNLKREIKLTGVESVLRSACVSSHFAISLELACQAGPTDETRKQSQAVSELTRGVSHTAAMWLRGRKHRVGKLDETFFTGVGSFVQTT